MAVIRYDHIGTQFDADLVGALADLHEAGLLGTEASEAATVVEEVR